MTDRSRQGLWDSHEPLLRVAAAVGLAVATALWVGPSLLRADLFEDDATQHVWWLYRYADPALFRGDIMVDYFRTMAPLGYRALYGVVARFVDALLAAKLLSGVLYLASGWLAWKIGTSLGGQDKRAVRGLLAVVSFVVVVSVGRTIAEVLAPMAFQRTFSLPLLLMCLWALIARRYRWVGASWVASALVYPAILPRARAHGRLRVSPRPHPRPPYARCLGIQFLLRGRGGGRRVVRNAASRSLGSGIHVQRSNRNAGVRPQRALAASFEQPSWPTSFGTTRWDSGRRPIFSLPSPLQSFSFGGAASLGSSHLQPGRCLEQGWHSGRCYACSPRSSCLGCICRIGTRSGQSQPSPSSHLPRPRTPASSS